MGIPYSTQSHFYHASGLVSATWPVHQDQKVHLLHELQASSDQPLKNTRILATVKRKQNGKRFKNYRQKVKILKKKNQNPCSHHQSTNQGLCIKQISVTFFSKLFKHLKQKILQDRFTISITCKKSYYLFYKVPQTKWIIE